MNPSLRSYLFVPGNRPERFDKAHAAGADAVIVDLEDAVAPDAKAAARDALSNALSNAVRDDRQVMVRINGAQTPWFEADLAALAGHPGVAAIVLPKAESVDQIAAVAYAGSAGQAGRAPLAVLPLVESARGFAEVGKLCSAPGVVRVVFGTLDFQVDLGMEADDSALLPFSCGLVLASRLAGIGAPVDGVSTVIDDAQAVLADAQRARRLGFSGKLCIHPKQVAPVHAAYAWTAEEQAWAARVLAAVAESGGSAVAVDGKMVDAPVIARARRIVG